MSDTNPFGFARLVPGFDFLQNLGKGGAQAPQMPSLSSWIAPTLNVEELDKRITELKAVHFWLDQNSKALGATIQALEVQKMTLSTLQGMNFSMGELAEALTLKPAGAAASGAKKAPEAAAPAQASRETADSKAATPDGQGSQAGNGVARAPVDPMQWWGALTQQFQEIAASAMQDAAQQADAVARIGVSAGGKRAAGKAGSASGAAAGAKKSATRKPPARKKAAKP